MLKRLILTLAAISVVLSLSAPAEAGGRYYGSHGGRVILGSAAVLGATAVIIASQPREVIIERPVVSPGSNCFQRQYGWDMQNRPLFETVCR